ncbi:hypothetical protein NSU02_17600 [Aeribacillus sp. FSL W8-0870]|uniref:hypothetical protein n=1 Tax=Aeribacillus sp. FSL W8-0870 TaxID=2954706 RepID=UPI0030D24E55
MNNGTKINEICMDQAYNGWDGHIQIGTLNLSERYGWINLYLDDLSDIPIGLIGVEQ